jgi:large subunit ribosomal protein L22
MTSRAIARFVRVSPRKIRYVLDIVRGKGVEDAFAILDNTNKGATFYIRQVLKSALDNAVKKTKGAADASNLYVSKATADGGPTLKRWKAASMGRANPILRRTAHITIELDMAGEHEHVHGHEHKHAHEPVKKETKHEKSAKPAVKKKETKTKSAAKR